MFNVVYSIILNKVKHAHLRLRPTGDQPSPLFSPLAKKEARLPRRPGWRAWRPESDGGLSAGPSLLFFRLRPPRQSPVASLGSGWYSRQGMMKKCARRLLWRPLHPPQTYVCGGEARSIRCRARRRAPSRAHFVSAPGQFTTGGVLLGNCRPKPMRNTSRTLRERPFDCGVHSDEGGRV